MTGLGTSLALDDKDGDEAAIDQLDDAKLQKRWVQEIKFYETKALQWEEKAKKILRRYKDERSPREQKVPRFNILWSNIQTLLPALYSRRPKADIERRFRDQDDLGRYSSMVLERSIQYFLNEEFDAAIRQAVMDRLLPGRGTVWVRYEPHFKDASEDENEEVADEGEEITDNIESYDDSKVSLENGEEMGEEVENEVICFDYVHWQDEGHTFGRTWDEVEARWRKVYLTREKLIERFGEEIGDAITLDYSPHDLKDNKYDEVEKKATIYEIWCKTDKTVYWVHKDYQKGPLDKQYDPLELTDFWPAPIPMMATLANDTCIPVPDYQEYQDQANELDELTSRIGAITRAVKVVGVHDASAQGVERMLAEGVENQTIPITQWTAHAEKGGLGGVVEFLPMKEILETLLGLYEARDKVKSDLYEITGIADILRGASNANETATAQQIKSQFGTLRLSAQQDDVQRFVRDLVKIGTEIIADHFSIETIKKICGVELLTAQEKMIVQQRMQMLQHIAASQQQTQHAPQGGMTQQAPQSNMPMPSPGQLPPLPPLVSKMDQEDLAEAMQNPTWEEVEELLKNDITLAYKIDIETDSTIKFDQDSERDARVQFLEATGGFLQSAMQNQNPDLAPLLAKLLMFGVRGFKVGKELESAFEIAIHKLEKDAQNPQQKPNPEMLKIQGDQQEAQGRLQLEQAKLQGDMQLRQAEMQADQQLQAQKSSDEQKRLQLQAQVDAHQGQVDAEVEKYKVQLQGQLDMQRAKLESETKIAVAQIQAKTQLKATLLGKDNVGADAEGEPLPGGASPGQVELIQTVMQQLQQQFAGVLQSHQQLIDHMNAPKQIMRDENGNIVGVGNKKVVRDENGNISAIH